MAASMPSVVDMTAVRLPRSREVRNARMIASFSYSFINQRKLNPSIGKPSNCEELKASSNTTRKCALIAENVDPAECADDKADPEWQYQQQQQKPLVAELCHRDKIGG